MRGDDQPPSPEAPIVAPGSTVVDDATPLSPDPEPLADDRLSVPPLDGRTVLPERYELGGEIARGGIGRILRARDLHLDRIVALKELRLAHPVAVLRFKREIRITAALQHPNIIPLHEAGRWPNGQLFYAMKFVEGRTFKKALEQAAGFAERLALLPVLVDVAEAIAYSHSQSIIHRDLKPANVLVGPFGETVVIDWGLAKHLDEPELVLPAPSSEVTSAYETTAGTVVGTPAYMPPEQASGLGVDATCDVYALGAMLYHLIAGVAPYHEQDETSVLERVRTEPPTDLILLSPDAPKDLVAIVEKAMARSPKDRYPTCREMTEELTRYATGGLVGAYRYGLLELFARFFERQRALVVTVALALSALFLFGGISVRSFAMERDRANTNAANAIAAAAVADRRVDELTVEKARALLDRDPTLSVAWLMRPHTIPSGAATIAAWAEERGVAEQVLVGHSSQVSTVAYSPNGDLVATGGDDKRVMLWNQKTGAATELAGHADRVTKVAFSPNKDDGLLGSASYDGTVRLYALDGKLVRVLTGHKAPVKFIAFSHDGSRLCSIASDGEVRVWDPKSGAFQTRSHRFDRDLYCAFSPDDGTLLSGSHAGALVLWSLATGAERSFVGHRGPVRSAAFSPDGKSIVSGGEDGTVRLWSAADGSFTVLGSDESTVQNVAFSPGGSFLAWAGMNGKVVAWDAASRTSRVVGEHAERVAALAFSAGGRYLASSGWDKVVRIHDMQTDVNAVLRGHRDAVVALAFSPDGEHLASASWDKSVRIWGEHHAHERRVLHGHTVGVKTVAFSPDGKLVASGGHDDTVRLWNVVSGSSRVLLGHTDHVFRVVFSPDGKWVASSSDDRTVRLWSVYDERVRVFTGHQGDVEELAFSPDGTRLASGAKDKTARLWSVDSASPPVVLEHDHDVTGVAFAPKGDLLATASRDGTVRLWDGHTGASKRVLRGHSDEVWGVAFSPDGTRLASASADDSVMVWNPTSDDRTRFANLSGARVVAFSPDGRRFAVAGAAPRLWVCDLSPANCSELRGHLAVVRDLVFMPDGRTLATASGDSTVQIWDLATHERRVFEGHAAPVFGLALSPDGRTLASGSGDGDVRLWEVAPPPLPSELRKFLAGLTRERDAPGMDGAPSDE